MKRRLILALAALLLLTLAACGDGGESASSAADGDVYLSGDWVHVKTTHGDEAEPVTVPEIERVPPRLVIGTDDTTMLEMFFEFDEEELFEVTVEGMLVRTGETSFTVAEHAWVDSIGSYTMPDAYLEYDRESGLLRYTMPGEPDTHHYFKRG